MSKLSGSREEYRYPGKASSDWLIGVLMQVIVFECQNSVNFCLQFVVEKFEILMRNLLVS